MDRASEPQDLLELPRGWLAPSPRVVSRAKATALASLALEGAHPVHERLAAYYDRAGDEVGATFLDLNPNLLDDVTPADVLAVVMLGGPISPACVRRLLEASPGRTSMIRALLRLPDGDLTTVGTDELVAMEHLLTAARDAFGESNREGPWERGALLCARKRSDLFPTHHAGIRRALGVALGPLSHRQEWLLYRQLLRDLDVRAAFFTALDVANETDGRLVTLDLGLLRVLETCLVTMLHEE